MRRILKAKEILPKVRVPDHLFEVVARMCISLQVDGHRPDIIIAKSARTLAAYNGRDEVTPQNMLDCAFLTLSHRTRNLGVEPPASDQQIEEGFKKALDLVQTGPK